MRGFKMKKRFNPLTLILPRVDLVDTIFDVTMCALKYYFDYYKKTPKLSESTTKYVREAAGRASYFLFCVEQYYKGQSTYDYDFDENQKEIIKSLNYIMPKIATLPIEDKFIKFIIKAHNTLKDSVNAHYMRISQKTSFTPVQLEMICSDLLMHQINSGRFFDAVLTLSHDNSWIFREDLDNFIEEYDPKLPIGWKEDESYFEGRFEKSYSLDSHLASLNFNIPFSLKVEIKKRDHERRGDCGYDAQTRIITLGLYILPKNDFTAYPALEQPEEIYGTILHECVHLLQALMGQGTNEFSFTGLPYPRREDFRTYHKEAEKALKLEYQTNGLDPNLVDFHHLDDVEFYSVLLDKIIKFIKNEIREPTAKGLVDPCHIDILPAMDKFIASESFFKSLQHFQTDKYTLAAQNFKEAILDNLASLERDYVCKIRDARKVKRS